MLQVLLLGVACVLLNIASLSLPVPQERLPPKEGVRVTGSL